MEGDGLVWRNNLKVEIWIYSLYLLGEQSIENSFFGLDSYIYFRLSEVIVVMFFTILKD